MTSVDGLASFDGCREWSTMFILTRVRLWLNEAFSRALDPGGMSSHEAGLSSLPSALRRRSNPALIYCFRIKKRKRRKGESRGGGGRIRRKIGMTGRKKGEAEAGWRGTNAEPMLLACRRVGRHGRSLGCNCKLMHARKRAPRKNVQTKRWRYQCPILITLQQ